MKIINTCKVGSLVSLITLSSCATMFSGSKQKVDITTNPAGAEVFINGQDQNAVTPVTLKVKKAGHVDYTFKKEGYEDGKVTDNGGLNGVFFLNIFSGFTGMIIDAATGAMHKISPGIEYTFPGTYDPSLVHSAIAAPVDTEVVDRDAPGQTSLEQTIIRWSIDSDPQGARVFWRVVSSTNEVKNTNETYLMTTPYEETRSFNILGLTYENAQDVQIEIKLSSPGYNDQVKRFNVRQAIDQQEISTFFQMVKNAQ